MDRVAVANFIAETAYAYAYELAGAVVAISVILIFILLFRDKIINLRRFNSV